jgi:class 3 adenylate cyclase
MALLLFRGLILERFTPRTFKRRERCSDTFRSACCAVGAVVGRTRLAYNGRWLREACGAAMAVMEDVERGSAGPRGAGTLAWNEAERVLFVETLVLFPLALGTLRTWYLVDHPEAEPYFDPAMLRLVAWLYTLFLLRVAVIVPIGLAIRGMPRARRVFAHGVVQTWWLALAAVTWLHGPVTTPLWALYPTMGLVSLLLFDARIAFAGFGGSLVALYAAAIAERFELIPYAPIFAQWPEVQGRIADTWLWSNMVWPGAVISATFVMFAIVLRRSQWQAAQLQRTTELLKRLFGRYVSADVMRTLLDDPEAFDTAGDRREVTILMSDLRGFTALAERTPPEHVLSALNEYLGIMIEICFKHGGTVNEILGDAVMVIFGAPLSREGHAASAVACAIEMQNAMHAVNRRNAVTGFPRLEMGIGLNTATVIAGNIGSTRRARFGVIGAGVNVASRIESYAAGGQVLASQSVVDRLPGRLRIDGRHEVVPKGAGGPITVYEIGGIGGDVHLAVERDDQPFHAPPRGVRLRYRIVSGKHVGDRAYDATVVGFSTTGMDLATGGPLGVFDEVQLHLVGVSSSLRALAMYAKVVAAPTARSRVVRIRFTALPAEVLAYLEGLSAHAPEPRRAGGSTA